MIFHHPTRSSPTHSQQEDLKSGCFLFSARGRSSRGSARLVPPLCHHAAGWVPALGVDLPSVTGRKSPPGRERQPQGTREGVQRSLPPTTPLTLRWQRCRSSQQPHLKLSSLQPSPAFSLSSGSAGANPQLCLPEQSPRCSLHRPAQLCPRLCRRHRGHRSRLLPGYIHKTSPCRGLGRGIRLRGTAEPPHSPPCPWQLFRCSPARVRRCHCPLQALQGLLEPARVIRRFLPLAVAALDRYLYTQLVRINSIPLRLSQK